MFIYTLSDLIGLGLLVIIGFVLGVVYLLEVASNFWHKVRGKP